jgi:hypothetical protein
MSTTTSDSRYLALLALATAGVLSIPLLAMQWTDEVVWDAADFITAGVLLMGTGLAYRLATRRAGTLATRGAFALALGTALLLVWANLAVGVIGHPSEPANLLYLGVLAVFLAGSLLARLRPAGMAGAMFATAAAQALVAVAALIFRLGHPVATPLEIIGVNGMFIVLFAGSGLLFAHAAHREPAAAREV